MKREDIIDALEYIDEEYIEEADQGRKEAGSAGDSGKITSIRKRNASVRKWGTLAASLAVLVIAAFVLTGVLRTRNGNMDAKSTGAAAVEESQAEQFKAEEPEPAGAAAEAFEASEPADTAAEAFEAEETFEAAEAYEAEEADALETAGAAEKESREEMTAPAADGPVRIRVLSDAGEVVFVLNDTPAAGSLASQLPFSTDAEPYSDNEVVFHPEEPLDTGNGKEGGGTAGYLGYFEPWDNVVMYYGDFDEYPGLYILGEAVSGADLIKEIRGRITVDMVQ